MSRTDNELTTTVPADDLPLVILHTRYRFYSKTPIRELREYLEPRMSTCEHPESVINAWLRDAHDWQNVLPKEEFQNMLREYHS